LFCCWLLAQLWGLFQRGLPDEKWSTNWCKPNFNRPLRDEGVSVIRPRH
jgi:hypothetical protein